MTKARRDITPEPGCCMPGYLSRNKDKENKEKAKSKEKKKRKSAKEKGVPPISRVKDLPDLPKEPAKHRGKSHSVPNIGETQRTRPNTETKRVSEPQREKVHSEPQRIKAYSELQREKLHSEPQREKVHSEPQREKVHPKPRAPEPPKDRPPFRPRDPEATKHRFLLRKLRDQEEARLASQTKAPGTDHPPHPPPHPHRHHHKERHPDSGAAQTVEHPHRRLSAGQPQPLLPENLIAKEDKQGIMFKRMFSKDKDSEEKKKKDQEKKEKKEKEQRKEKAREQKAKEQRAEAKAKQKANDRRSGGAKREGSQKRKHRKKNKGPVTVDVSKPLEWPSTPETILEYHKHKAFLTNNEEWLIVELNEYECMIENMDILKLVARNSKFLEVDPPELVEEFFNFVDELPTYDEIINYDVWQEFTLKNYEM